MDRTSARKSTYITTERFARLLHRANISFESEYSVTETRIGAYVKVRLSNLDDETSGVLGEWLHEHRDDRGRPDFLTRGTARAGKITFRVPVGMWKKLKGQPGISFVEYIFKEGGPTVVWLPQESERCSESPHREPTTPTRE